MQESLPNDDLIQNALCYFHGNTAPITLEYFDRQVEELAKNVKAKLDNDLIQFKNEHQLDPRSVTEEERKDQKLMELQQFVAPSYPELFASGCIINGFTP